MTENQSTASTLRAIRASLDLTQEQLTDRLGVSFASVNRWEGGANRPQKAARTAIAALAAEAGIGTADSAAGETESAVRVSRRRSRRRPTVLSTKTMEQVLWGEEGSSQRASEFFTPTTVGFVMTHTMRPEPGEICHSYARSSAELFALLKRSKLSRTEPTTARMAICESR